MDSEQPHRGLKRLISEDLTSTSNKSPKTTENSHPNPNNLETIPSNSFTASLDIPGDSFVGNTGSYDQYYSYMLSKGFTPEMASIAATALEKHYSNHSSSKVQNVFKKIELPALAQQRSIEWLPRKAFPTLDCWRSLVVWMANFESHSINGRDYGYIIISGGGGTGKTRSGIELPYLLQKISFQRQESNQVVECGFATKPDWKVLHLFVEMQNPLGSDKCQRSEQDMEKEITALDWLRDELASLYAVPLPTSIDLSTLLLEIRRAEGLLDSKEYLLILLQVDEFQRNLAMSTRLCRLLSSFMTKIIPKQAIFHRCKTFIVPVFTGTWVGALTLGTEYDRLHITLSGLDDLQMSHKFFERAISARIQTLRLKKADVGLPASELDELHLNHLFILSLLGSIPGMILTYVDILVNNPQLSVDTQLELIQQKINVAIQNQYQFQTIPDALLKDHLLVLWYFATQVSSSYELNGSTITETMPSGFLYLNQTGPDLYTVNLPLIFVQQWASDIFGFHTLIKPINQLSEVNFPEFCLQIARTTSLMLKKSAEVEHALQQTHPGRIPTRTWQMAGKDVIKVKTTIREFYRGAAQGCDEILDEQHWLDVSDVQYNFSSPETYPFSNRIFRANHSAHGADGVTPITAEQYQSYSEYADNRRAASNGTPTGTDLFSDLQKDLCGRKCLAIISTKPILNISTAKLVYSCTNSALPQNDALEQKVVGVSLYHIKPELLKLLNPVSKPSADDMKWSIAKNLLIIDSPDRLLDFGRGLFHSVARKSLESEQVSKF